MKKRSIFIFTVFPLIIGYLFASFHNQHFQSVQHVSTNFALQFISPTDRITIINEGNIVTLTNQFQMVVTSNQHLIEPLSLGNTYIAVDKQTNYSSLEEFGHAGTFLKTLANGKTNSIDTMSWFTDPSSSMNEKEIAFVSDKDRLQTNLSDNALYTLDLSTNMIKKIVDPDPHSGGIAHPVWNPINLSNIIYDYYQYDASTLEPYSTIMSHNRQSLITSPLTTEEENAYQGAFSPDGKQFIFLGRADNAAIMYLADYTGNTLANVRILATGDYAYPVFSYTQNRIYYLHAQGNKGYDLYTASLKNAHLTNVQQITTSGQLAGNSSFGITKNDKK